MSTKLSDLKVGPLKTVSSRQVKSQVLPTISQIKENIENQVSIIPSELQLISQIPGSGPFITVDLIPDIIFLFQYEGSKAFIETLPKNENGDIIGQDVEPIKSEALLQILESQTWENFLSSLYLYTQIQPQELIPIIYNAGVQPLSILFAQADPQNPSSLIFKNSSQDVHRSSEKVEIEMIRNEPEISESATEQCACGSRRIRTQTVQTRGGDEASTVFAECVKCKLKWKFSAA